MASKLSSLANSVVKNLGKHADDIGYKEVKSLLKSNNLINSSVEEASESLTKILSRRKEIGSAFENAVELGSNTGKELFVSKGSKVNKQYNRLVHNKNLSPGEAIEKVHARPRVSPNEAKAAAKAEFDDFRNRSKLIEKNRIHSKELRSKVEKMDIENEIARNYRDSSLAHDIADNIEKRGGYVGTDPAKAAQQRQKRVNNLKGQYPETKAGIKELHNNRRNDKKAWMQDKYSKQYMGAMKDLESGNFDNPILQGYIKNGMDKDKITKDFLSTERVSAIKGAKAENMQLRDWMEYARVPQHAVTAGTTLWLVNKMASNGGQQTNSQLYGQSQY